MDLPLPLAIILASIKISAEMDGYIVGGSLAKITDYPHSAALVIYCDSFDSIAAEVCTCGGSILNQRVLLTAAHCLAGCTLSSKVDVTVGNSNKEKGETFSGASFVLHEDFEEKSVRNDIALAVLKHTLRFGRNVKRVLLMRKPPRYESATLAGWGLIDPLQQDYEDDSFVCEECARLLREARKFKSQVLETLNALQVNGLIKLNKAEDHTLVTKVTNEYESDLEEKFKMDDEKLTEDIKLDLNRPDPVEREVVLELEREKRITVARKARRPPVKSEARHEVTEDFRCAECSAVLPNAYVYHTHMNKHFPNHICETCGKELEREKRITVARKARRPPVKSEARHEVTEDFRCAECSAVLPNAYVYHTHMNKHFPNHICETCGKGFLTKKKLKRHMPSHIKGPFKCENCDVVFSNYNTLNSHRQRKHKSVDLYACPHCPERFATMTRRSRHLATRHGVRVTHRCAICARRFLLSGNLSTHMRNKHFKEKRHFCVECGAGFFQKLELRGHMATHTGAKEFQCSLCSKSYPRKKALDVHMRGHLDDRRFHCELCGKKFLQKCTLLTHVKTHNRGDEHK